jgi:hypothetical protein
MSVRSMERDDRIGLEMPFQSADDESLPIPVLSPEYANCPVSSIKGGLRKGSLIRFAAQVAGNVPVRHENRSTIR